MRRSLRMACGTGLGVALLVLGCNTGDDDDAAGDSGGGLTPSQVCANIAYDQCDRIWACASEDQRRSLGFNGDKLACGGSALQQLGCSSATQAKICQGAQASSAADAAACSSQVKGASCSDVATQQVASYASACGQCAIRP